MTRTELPIAPSKAKLPPPPKSKQGGAKANQGQEAVSRKHSRKGNSLQRRSVPIREAVSGVSFPPSVLSLELKPD